MWIVRKDRVFWWSASSSGIVLLILALYVLFDKVREDYND